MNRKDAVDNMAEMAMELIKENEKLKYIILDLLDDARKYHDIAKEPDTAEHIYKAEKAVRQ